MSPFRVFKNRRTFSGDWEDPDGTFDDLDSCEQYLDDQEDDEVTGHVLDENDDMVKSYGRKGNKKSWKNIIK